MVVSMTDNADVAAIVANEQAPRQDAINHAYPRDQPSPKNLISTGCFHIGLSLALGFSGKIHILVTVVLLS
jgi:hypothetical protein